MTSTKKRHLIIAVSYQWYSSIVWRYSCSNKISTYNLLTACKILKIFNFTKVNFHVILIYIRDCPCMNGVNEWFDEEIVTHLAICLILFPPLHAEFYLVYCYSYSILLHSLTRFLIFSFQIFWNKLSYSCIVVNMFTLCVSLYKIKLYSYHC